MARLSLDDVISMALTLLDSEGLEGLTTRKLAQSLKIEQPTLYWHVRNKQTLMNMLSEAILAKHHTRSAPLPTESWQQFLQENALSFRKALLVHRDGARLHIGTSPTPPQFEQAEAQLRCLCDAGFSVEEALFILQSISHFTLGAVLEEQATNQIENNHVIDAAPPLLQEAFNIQARTSAEMAFHFGLKSLIFGFSAQLDEKKHTPIEDGNK
ncbi:tetracycline resistance transcriptional repressor TetR [Citrobacter freundii]|uniref:Tetracycline repressor protein class E n=6 Tax=Gammaproteobacteria TaxID=1236 RepID=TETR5_ECOLX|nr:MULTISPECIES: tetracycline resistance transcriptional repressor TetR [Gammaproteobacteria]P21337.1 RecName: Full=Tetracycline repressor protein class E [Escherichia coli]AHV37589.1 TetR family transcriptional regulator [Aeromonas hydrophila YL17]EIW8806434.1 TetR family transcriptional regulator [Klebsiella pneumoniae]HDN9001934.1 tetracycline resistance transcriptional repressor TetR [Aeromonas veronii AMC24]HEB5079689.1 tetracycline resistance transcriptional repressor TetR [Aeromonas hyd